MNLVRNLHYASVHQIAFTIASSEMSLVNCFQVVCDYALLVWVAFSIPI